MNEKLSSSWQPVVLLHDIMKKKERKSISHSTVPNSVSETQSKRLRKFKNGDDSPWEKFRKERELKKLNREKREERRPFQCNKCLQFEDELYEFSSFDINAVEERIAIGQGNEETDIIELKEYKIKKFTIYDAVMHVCQLDKELIEKGLSLYLSGCVIPICDAKSETDGTAVKNIGPLTDWWISYSNDDNDVMIGVSTDLAYYYLVTPSDEYRVYFFPLQEKAYLTNIIINSLEENERITYRDLVERVEATTLPYDIEDDIELSAKSLHYHLDFILDQLSDYDKSADDFDTVLMNTSCAEYLKELSGKVFAISQNNVTDSSNENTASEKRKSMIHKLPRERSRKRSKSVVEYKSVNTKLVKMIFDDIFRDYTYSMDDSHQESNIHSEFSDSDDLFFPERDWTLDCSKRISVCYKNLITRNYDKSFYQTVEIRNETYEVGECIFVQFTNNSTDVNYLVKIITIYKSQDDGGIHVIFLTSASETILGKAANENEHFLLNRCTSLNFSAIKYKSDIQYKPPLDNWRIIGGQNLEEEGINNDGRRFYYSKSYHRSTCRFEDIEDKFLNPCGIICPNCILKAKKKQENAVILLGLKYNECSNGLIKYRSLMWMNETFHINDAIFLEPNAFEFNFIPRVNRRPFMYEVDDNIYPEYYRKAKTKTMDEIRTYEPYKIGVITEIYLRSMPNADTNADDVRLRVKKFYRPENTHLGSAASYEADFNLLYSSDEVVTVRLSYVIGKCNVLQCTQNEAEFLYDQKYFYFNQSYDACMEDFTTLETSFDSIPDVQVQNSITPLKTMDLFCGCGGLSEGLRQSGVAKICWALDNDQLSTSAFKKNHPDCAVFTCDCNALLEWLMNGNEEQILPSKGEVDLLCGGPPCQGFSGLNKFSNRCCAKLKNSLVTTFLSLCDWLRPRFFLLENVQNFARTNDSMILKSTLRCLLAMGYQCAFAKLQAGNYGVPQRRTRIFILAAAPGERLPQFPEPSHVFDSISLFTTIGQIKMIPRDNWPTSAPYRRVTVRDTIFDLAGFYNGDDIQFYDPETQSHFQKIVRRNSESNYIYDHVCQILNPIMTERIMRIPKERGADWRDLPNVEITLSNGIKTRKLEYEYEDIKNGRSKYGAFRGVCPCAAGKHGYVACSLYRQNDTLIPWFLAHTANDNNQWNGAYGRLDYDDVFQTTLTKLSPGGKIGRVIHPEQDRILTVRECARAQGFPDSYEFCGEIGDKIKQIGNAVPPMLARAIGCEIKKSLTQ